MQIIRTRGSAAGMDVAIEATAKHEFLLAASKLRKVVEARGIVIENVRALATGHFMLEATPWPLCTHRFSDPGDYGREAGDESPDIRIGEMNYV